MQAIASHAEQRRGPLVLVVENERLLRESLARALRVLGAEVVMAENGQEALALLAEGARPDLILTDLFMPVLGGEELLHTVRRDPELATIPMIAVSGSRTSEPFDLYLAKPFGLAEVRTVLGRFRPVELAH
jgi:CheY-like chemotaxis protein